MRKLALAFATMAEAESRSCPRNDARSTAVKVQDRIEWLTRGRVERVTGVVSRWDERALADVAGNVQQSRDLVFIVEVQGRPGGS